MAFDGMELTVKNGQVAEAESFFAARCGFEIARNRGSRRQNLANSF
jgi:hypothetical protein